MLLLFFVFPSCLHLQAEDALETLKNEESEAKTAAQELSENNAELANKVAILEQQLKQHHNVAEDNRELEKRVQQLQEQLTIVQQQQQQQRQEEEEQKKREEAEKEEEEAEKDKRKLRQQQLDSHNVSLDSPVRVSKRDGDDTTTTVTGSDSTTTLASDLTAARVEAETLRDENFQLVGKMVELEMAVSKLEKEKQQIVMAKNHQTSPPPASDAAHRAVVQSLQHQLRSQMSENLSLQRQLLDMNTVCVKLGKEKEMMKVCVLCVFDVGPCW